MSYWLITNELLIISCEIFIISVISGYAESFRVLQIPCIYNN